MLGLSEMCDETANNTKTEKYLEENSTVQDDYKKLKQENECYRQELYVLRLKLQASDALGKELQEANDALEQSLAQSATKAEKVHAEREEKNRATREMYENHIANLEKNCAQSAQEIVELHEEIKKYKNLMNEQLHNSTSTEDNLIYNEKIEELTILLNNERKKQEQFEERFAHTERQCQEFEDILKITKEQLVEKNTALETTREELAVKRMELESLKITPASDTCKGNSLFAEVEDRRQMLLDKMKVLQDKYNEAKSALNTKMSEIKILKAEKAAMIRKWETDTIDTLQENVNLLDKYKSRIFELENKLKIEIKRNNQTDEIQSIGDSFNYAQSLLMTKKKELEQLNEKLEKQSMELLAREEINHDISKQLRYWRSKAMSMEAQILAIKAQLEIEETNDNNSKTLLEAIENCKITGNADVEKACDLKVTSDSLDNNKYRRKPIETSEKSTVDAHVDGQKESDRKILRFAMDTEDAKSKFFKEYTHNNKNNS